MSKPNPPTLACGKRPATRPPPQPSSAPPPLACSQAPPQVPSVHRQTVASTQSIAPHPLACAAPPRPPPHRAPTIGPPPVACGKRSPQMPQSGAPPPLACARPPPPLAPTIGPPPVAPQKPASIAPPPLGCAPPPPRPILACGKRAVPTPTYEPMLACFMPAPPQQPIQTQPIMAECWANPMKTNEPQIPFICERLTEKAKHLWALTLHQAEHFTTKEYCDNALQKYKQFFYSMCVAYCNERRILYPQDKDVHVVWVSHAIRIDEYAKDCEKISSDSSIKVFPSVLEELLSDDERRKREAETKTFMQNCADVQVELSITSADLLKDVNWYMNFLQENPEVVPGQPLSDTFLKEALKDYERYLWLIYKYRDQPDVNLNASYKADIIWHSHMLNSEQYTQDCNALVGWYLSHQPWPDRPIEADWDIRKQNQELWKQEFGINNYLHY